VLSATAYCVPGAGNCFRLIRLVTGRHPVVIGANVGLAANALVLRKMPLPQKAACRIAGGVADVDRLGAGDDESSMAGSPPPDSFVRVAVGRAARPRPVAAMRSWRRPGRQRSMKLWLTNKQCRCSAMLAVRVRPPAGTRPVQAQRVVRAVQLQVALTGA
jgi:hypothetical protein